MHCVCDWLCDLVCKRVKSLHKNITILYYFDCGFSIPFGFATYWRNTNACSLNRSRIHKRNFFSFSGRCLCADKCYEPADSWMFDDFNDLFIVCRPIYRLEIELEINLWMSIFIHPGIEWIERQMAHSRKLIQFSVEFDMYKGLQKNRTE